MNIDSMKSGVRVLLITVAVVALPFCYWDAPLDPQLLPAFCLLSVTLLVASALLFLNSLKQSAAADGSNWIHPVPLMFTAYWLLVGLSLLQAINFSEALFEWARVTLSGILLIAMLVVAPRSAEEPRLFTRLAVVCSLTLSVIGICQLFGWGFAFLVQHGIPAGTFANRGVFISFMCLLFPFSALGCLQANRIWRTVSAVSAILAIVLIVLAENRSSWVSVLIAGMAVGAVFLWSRRSRSQSVTASRQGKTLIRNLIIGVSVAALLTTAAAIWGDRADSLVTRLKSVLDTEHASVSERLVVWKKTLQMAQDHPILGVGAGNCKIVFPEYGIAGTQEESGYTFLQRPHNDYLWVLSEVGIPGLLTYLAFFVFAIRSAVLVARKQSSQRQSTFALAALFAIVCYSVDSMFSFPKERVTHLALLMVIVAQVVAIDRSPVQSIVSRGRLLVRIGFGTMVILSVLLLLFGWVRLRSEIETKAALIARENNLWLASIEAIDRARSEFATLDPTTTPLAWYSGVALYSLGDFDRALEDFKQAYRDNPNHIHVLNNLATCYELRGDHRSAAELYERLLIINPNFLEARLNLAAVYYNSENYREAATVIAEVDSSCVDPKYLLYRQKIAEKVAN